MLIVPFSKTQTLQALRTSGFTMTSVPGNNDTACLVMLHENLDWYTRQYNFQKDPPFIKVSLLHGQWCLQRFGNGTQMGESICNTTITLSIDDSVGWSEGAGDFGSSCWMLLNPTGPLQSPNGTYWVCGTLAYPWLPTNWSGSCYLGYIVPHIHITKLSEHPHILNHIRRRMVAWYEQIFGVFMPPYGQFRTYQELGALQTILEAVANETADALNDISAEMVAIRTVALQNRMALDMLLAEKGGTCALIGSDCCTYIPDASENITNIVQHIRQQVRELHQNDASPGLWSWLTDWSTGGWMIRIMTFIGTIIIILVVILCCGIPLLKKIIISIMTGWNAPTAMLYMAPDAVPPVYVQMAHNDAFPIYE